MVMKRIGTRERSHRGQALYQQDDSSERRESFVPAGSIHCRSESLEKSSRHRNKLTGANDDSHGKNHEKSGSEVPRELAEKKTNLRGNHSERRGTQEMFRGIGQLERTKPQQPVA